MVERGVGRVQPARWRRLGRRERAELGLDVAGFDGMGQGSRQRLCYVGRRTKEVAAIFAEEFGADAEHQQTLFALPDTAAVTTTITIAITIID